MKKEIEQLLKESKAKDELSLVRALESVVEDTEAFEKAGLKIGDEEILTLLAKLYADYSSKNTGSIMDDDNDKIDEYSKKVIFSIFKEKDLDINDYIDKINDLEDKKSNIESDLEEVKKLVKKEKEAASNNNSIAGLLKVLGKANAVVMGIIAVITFIIFADAIDAGIAFIYFIAIAIVGFICTLFILSLAEIIQILHDIRRKVYNPKDKL